MLKHILFSWVFIYLRLFAHRTDDMLAVLFPHLFEDAEYLLPESEAMNATSFDLDEAVHEAEDMRLDYDMAPVAGPSQLS